MKHRRLLLRGRYAKTKFKEKILALLRQSFRLPDCESNSNCWMYMCTYAVAHEGSNLSPLLVMLMISLQETFVVNLWIADAFVALVVKRSLL